MRIAVRGIVELICPNRVGQLLRQATRHLLVLIRIAVGHGGHLAQLRPQSLDDLIFLGRLIVGHDDDASIAARIADMRQADTRVARGALDHGTTRFQESAPLGVQNDPLRRAILHRTAGIHELGFAQDLAARLFAQAAQANQRGVADRIRKPVTNSHPWSFSSTTYAARARRRCDFTVPKGIRGSRMRRAGGEEKNPRTCRGIRVEQVLGKNPTRP